MGVSDEKRNELQQSVLNLFKINTKLSPAEAVYLSDLVANEVFKEGWQWHPPKVEDVTEYNRVALKPHAEVELLDRIIHGEPVPKDNSWIGDVLAGTKKSPWANKPFECEEPPTKPTWVRIPEFKDYEVNRDGVVRNFWTKRVLSFGTDPTHTVEMHGPDGSPMRMTIAEIMKATFGE